MTPAEWQPAEGVVVVDVAARRLRGHPKGLLHGKGAESRCSVESSSGATGHGFVQGNGMWNGDGDIGEVFGRQRRLRTPGYPALLGRWGAGTGAGAMAILWTAAMFLESDLDGGGGWIGVAGWVANNNVAWLSARPDAGSGEVAAGERWQCCVPWCAKFVASLFYSAGRSDCSSAVVAMINLPARSFLVVLYVV
jgi:hypothetical protein